MPIDHLQEYYHDNDESKRLVKDNQHRTEFLVTTKFLEKYLDNDTSVLDVGCGSGRYSLFCGQRGANVTALDLSPRNIDLLLSQINGSPMEQVVTAEIGNVLDLSDFSDGSFDVVLSMGPLYHLKSIEEKNQSISECLRVLKPGGILLVAYINKYFKFYQRIQRQDDPIKWEVMENIIRRGFKHDKDEAVFYFLSPLEAEALFSGYSGSILHHVSADGNSLLLADAINSMDENDFERYMQYHLEFCEVPHLLGSGLHNFIIFRK